MVTCQIICSSFSGRARYRASGVPPMPPLIQRTLAWLRERCDVALELSERQALLNRPWEAEFLHWSDRDGLWELHGRLAPADDGRRRGVTRGGWCACNRGGRA